MGDQDLSCTIKYSPAKFNDDMSSGFCFRVQTHTQTHKYRVDKRPTTSA